MNRRLPIAAICALCGGACGDTSGPRASIRVEIAPDSLQLLVSQTAVLSYLATNDNGSPASVSGVVWSSSDSTVARVGATGIVRARKPGLARIRLALGSVSDEIPLQVFPAAVASEDTTRVAGTLTTTPLSVDRDAIYVETGVGGPTTINGSGSFEVVTSSEVSTAVYALAGDRLFAMAISPQASREAIQLDARSTATALVFLSPLFVTAPPSIAEQLLALIDSQPETALLADAIGVHVNREGHLPDDTVADIAAAYQVALRAAESRLMARVVLAKSATAPGDAFRASGVAIGPQSWVGSTLFASVSNYYARDVDLYVLEADTSGHPTVDQATLANPFTSRRMLLRGAEWVPDVTSVSEWLSGFNSYGPFFADQSLVMDFTPERPRFLVYAYGLGLADPGDYQILGGAEGQRLALPALATISFNIVVPLVETLSGLKAKNLSDAAAYSSVRQLLDATFSGLQVSQCLLDADAGAPATMLWCAFAELLRRARERYEDRLVLWLSGWVSSLFDAPNSISTGLLFNAVARRLIAMSNIVSGARLVVTGYGVANAEMREEFDMTYNRLRGASDIENVAGDRQRGYFGEALPLPITVRVVDSAGAGVVGAWVRWELSTGRGSITQNFDTTDGMGVSSMVWTLGPVDTQQVLTASLAGTSDLVRFVAMAGSRPVYNISISPALDTVHVGQPSLYSALVRDQHGNALSWPSIKWESSDSTIAVPWGPSSSASIISIAGGSATIYATWDSVTASARILVSGSGPFGTDAARSGLAWQGSWSTTPSEGFSRSFWLCLHQVGSDVIGQGYMDWRYNSGVINTRIVDVEGTVLGQHMTFGPKYYVPDQSPVYGGGDAIAYYNGLGSLVMEGSMDLFDEGGVYLGRTTFSLSRIGFCGWQ